MSDFIVPDLDSVSQLTRWIDAVEDEHLEFKAARQQFSIDKLCQYASALANEGGGRLILGVTDKRPRKIVGSQAFLDLERARNMVHSQVRVRTKLEKIDHPDGRVLVFEFESHPMGSPVAYRGVSYMRDGESLVALNELRRKEIYEETAGDFSATVCIAATVSELSDEAIEAFRQRWLTKLEDSASDQDKDQAQRLRNHSIPELLENIGATVDGRVTYAALVLFGKEKVTIY